MKSDFVSMELKGSIHTIIVVIIILDDFKHSVRPAKMPRRIGTTH